MTVVIVDYGCGNLHSAAKAFEYAGSSRVVVSSLAKDVLAADRIVLPGVGAYGECKAGLERVPGLIEALETAVRVKGRPFLGICVGMQLLGERGLEFGETPGLGWIRGEVAAVQPKDPALKVPHMGWNTLHLVREHFLTSGVDGHAYFVHSFALDPKDRNVVIAEADYGGPVTALVVQGNVAGTQFHPEKSQKLGLKLIENFLAWKP